MSLSTPWPWVVRVALVRVRSLGESVDVDANEDKIWGKVNNDGLEDKDVESDTGLVRSQVG